MAYVETAKMNAMQRILDGITSHFQQRKASWVMSITTMAVGLVFLNDQLFSVDNPFANYTHMARFGNELLWGWLFFIVGAGRLVTLLVNGTIPGIWWTAHVRMVLTLVASLLWLQLAISVTWGVGLTPASVVYPLLLVMELLNGAQAAHDAQS